MRSVFARLGDLGENAGDELEDVEGLSLERVREGLVVRRNLKLRTLDPG